LVGLYAKRFFEYEYRLDPSNYSYLQARFCHRRLLPIMKFRSFLNSDPPALAALWQQQSRRSTANFVTSQLLEDFVFSKPYFDREGLIVAEDEGRIVGFAHGAFGPTDDQSDIDHDVGVTCLTLVAPDVEYDSVAPELLDRSEAYLRAKGAKLLYAGCVYPLNPFYLGFYGGSELPGVVESDESALATYRAAGYEEVDRCLIMSCDLANFRSPVDRRAIQNKRLCSVRRRAAGRATTWWEACTRPPTEVTVFDIVSTSSGELFGSVTYWMIEPLSTSRQTPIAGLTRLSIVEEMRGRGLASYLNSESLKALREAGIKQVEVQTMTSNKAAIGLYKKLGFQEIDCGIILRKKQGV
jgi:ribosomal protein S18 acetylase RimI-like enzyme